ncbi:MAG: hypothetical protein Kow00133_18010 [Amphiplicatus sp.]
MATSSIPVDLFNPGQVFACFGFLEAAEALLGDAAGGFEWEDESNTKFILRANGDRNPFEVVLEFLAEAEPARWGPVGYTDPPAKKNNQADEDELISGDDGEIGAESVTPPPELSETFYAKEGDRMSLPIRFGGGNRPTIELGHWADGSSRENFKLYAGNRSADRIARAMLRGVRSKATKKQRAKGEAGEITTKGVAQLWEEARDALIKRPFHVLTPMAGSFNFDPRGAWTVTCAPIGPSFER